MSSTYAIKDFGNVGVLTPLDAGFLLAQSRIRGRQMDGFDVFRGLVGLDIRLLGMRYRRVKELVTYNTNSMVIEGLHLGMLIAMELFGSGAESQGVADGEAEYAKRAARSCHLILTQHGKAVERLWKHDFHPKELKHSMSLSIESDEKGWTVGDNRVVLENTGLECSCQNRRIQCPHKLAVRRLSREREVMSAIRMLDSLKRCTTNEVERMPFLKGVELVWLVQC